MSGLINSQTQIKAIICSQDDLYTHDEIFECWSRGEKVAHNRPINDIAAIAAETFAHTFQHNNKDPIFIGRLFDTIQKTTAVNLGTSEKPVHSMQDTQGIVQKLKVWSQCINDCWIFGGICGLRRFELLSSIQDSIGEVFPRKTITLTEVAALKVCGYKKFTDGGRIFFIPLAPESFKLRDFREFVKQRKAETAVNTLTYLRGD
jgi:hypothetical protein